jgi:hypothetical protein
MGGERRGMMRSRIFRFDWQVLYVDLFPECGLFGEFVDRLKITSIDKVESPDYTLISNLPLCESFKLFELLGYCELKGIWSELSCLFVKSVCIKITQIIWSIQILCVSGGVFNSKGTRHS